MTTPTVGRIMWFYPNPHSAGLVHPRAGQPLSGSVASVSEDGMFVNMSVIDADGNPRARQNIPVVQADMPAPNGAYACWMPYQVGQARKHEPQPPVDNAHVAAGAEQFGSGIKTDPKYDEIKMEWRSLALHAAQRMMRETYHSADVIIADAQKFYAFLSGEAP